MTAQNGTGGRAKRRRGLLLKLAAVIAIVAVAAVALAPKLATPFVRNAITSAASGGGRTASLGGLSLGWLGSQKIESLVVNDASGTQVLDLTATMDRGLLGLLTGNLDLGTITVEGSATVLPPAPGAAPATPPATPAGPSSSVSVNSNALPKSLKATVDLRSFRVTIKEPGQADTVVDLAGTASLAAGQPVKADLTATAARGGQASGSAAIKASVDGLVRADGVLAPDKAVLDVTADLTEFPAALLDALAGANGAVSAALGRTLSANVRATGPAMTPNATVTLRAPNATADAAVAVQNDTLVATGPVMLRLADAQPVLAALPAAKNALENAGLTLAGGASVDVSVDGLKVPLQKSGAAYALGDLRGASAVATIKTGQTRASIDAAKLGRTGAPAPVVLQPGTITVDASRPGEKAAVNGALRFDLDGRPAGAIDLAATTGPVIDAQGKPITTLPAINGTLTARDVPLALAQPFVPPNAKLDLPADIGPTLTASVTAASAGADRPTDFDLSAQAAKLSVVGKVRLDGKVVTTTAPLVVTLQSPAGVLDRLLADKGMRITASSPATITVQELRASLDQPKAGMETPGAFRAVVRVQADRADGSLARENAEPVGFSGERLDALVTLENGDAKAGARLDRATIGGQAVLAGLQADLTACNALADTRTIDGVVTIATVTPAAAAPLIGGGAAGPALAELGTLRAEVRPTVGADGSQKVAFTLAGDRAAASGNAAIAGDTLTADVRLDRLAAAALDVVTKKPGLARAALGETVAGSATVRATRAAGGSFGKTADATVAIDAPLLKSSAPLGLRVEENAIRLTQAATIDWAIQPAVLDALTTPAPGTAPTAAPKAPPVRLARASQLRVNLASLVLPRGDAAVPLSVDLSATGADLPLVFADGTQRTFSNLRVAAKSTGTPGQANVTLGLNDGPNAVLDAALVASNIGVAGREPEVSGTAKLTQLPTAVVDALAGTGTTIADLLGAAATADVQIQRYPAEGATIALTADAPRATARYQGRVEKGVLVNTAPATLTLAEITRDFGFKLSRFVPVVGSFTKAATDRPAGITIERLAVPTKFDLAAVQLSMRADPGTGRYTLAGPIFELLNASTKQGGNRVGDSFAPFLVTMDKSVVKVSELKIPVGEFVLPAGGTVDLAGKVEDFFVALPAGALAGEALGGKIPVLGSALDVPFRSRGPLGGNNAWKIDPSVKLQDKKPEERIIEGIGDLIFNELNKKKDKDGKDGG